MYQPWNKAMLLVDGGMMLWLCIDKSCLNSTAVRNPRELVFRNKCEPAHPYFDPFEPFCFKPWCRTFVDFLFFILLFLSSSFSLPPLLTPFFFVLLSPLLFSCPLPFLYFPLHFSILFLPSPTPPLNFLPLHYLFISLPPSSLLLYLPSDTQIWRDSG